jgi:rhodanese-related sulfurtransferase
MGIARRNAPAWAPAVEVLVICRSGQRAYYATRILLQNGFNARNVAGGMLSLSHLAE